MEIDAEQLRTIRSERRSASDDRLAAVVEYVATRMAELSDPHRGAVKLNKIIWWADQESYRRVGYSITGSEYQRLAQGPVPYRFPPIRQLLASAKRVLVTRQDVGAPKLSTILEPGPASDIAAVRQLLTSADLELLDESLSKFHGWTGQRVSDFSHRESVAWQNLEDGDLIPDGAWLIDPHPKSPANFDVAQLLSDNGLAS